MSGPDEPMQRGPNTHRMDVHDVTTWTVIHTVRNVPTDDGRGMTLRDEWWEIPSFVVDEIDAARAAATPVESDDERHERLVASGRMTCDDTTHEHVPPSPEPTGLDAVRLARAIYHAARQWLPRESADTLAPLVAAEYARLRESKDGAPVGDLRAAVSEMFLDPVTGKPTSGWYCTNEIADRIRRALSATPPPEPSSSTQPDSSGRW